MLYFAVASFVFAMFAAWLGFGGVAVGAVSIASVLFVSFAILTVANFAFALLRSR